MITVQIDTFARASIEDGRWSCADPEIRKLLQTETDDIDVSYAGDRAGRDEAIVRHLSKFFPLRVVERSPAAAGGSGAGGEGPTVPPVDLRDQAGATEPS